MEMASENGISPEVEQPESSKVPYWGG